MIILKHLSAGLLYKEVAELPGISIGTVKQLLHKIAQKFRFRIAQKPLTIFKTGNN